MANIAPGPQDTIEAEARVGAVKRKIAGFLGL